MRTIIEIHLVEPNEKVDRKDVLELIHSNLIKSGLVKEPKINYGLTNKDKRKYVSFPLTDTILTFLQQNGTATTVAGIKPDSHTPPHQ